MPTLPRLPIALTLLILCTVVLPAPAVASSATPTSSMTRWLAGQIGPVPTTGVVPAGVIRMRAAGDGTAASITASGGAHPLRLVRSFRIPSGDPSAARLANWSWTYDSAVTAMAFSVAGDRAHAGTLLEQLTALQAGDGSIANAFDVLTGESSGVVRSAPLPGSGWPPRPTTTAFTPAATPPSRSAPPTACSRCATRVGSCGAGRA